MSDKLVFNPITGNLDKVRNDISDLGTKDHDLLDGLGDDDHSQYLNETRHDADDHSGLLPLDHTNAGDISNIGTSTHSQIDTHIAKTDLDSHGNTASQDIDFAKFKAIAMVCDNGATLPSTPATGQWFLHTPTGRNILYCYDGSDWQTSAIISFGSMTVYVDKTDGSDDMDKGTGVDSDAFATIQFAWDTIPPTFNGNVIININNESYAENLVLFGKNPAGNYTITLEGTMNQETTFTGTGGGTQGGAGTRGTTIKTGAGWTVNGYQNMIIRALTGNNAGQEKLIQSNTSDTITIMEYWDNAPHASTDTYEILDWTNSVGTGSAKAIDFSPAQVSVNVKYLQFTTTGTFAARVHEFSQVNWYGCKINRTMLISNFGDGIMYYSYIDATGKSQGLYVNAMSNFTFREGKIYNANTYNVYIIQGSRAAVGDVSLLDGNAKNTNNGVYVATNSIANVFSYTHIENHVTGINALTGGVAFNTSTAQYTNNTTDEDNNTGGDDHGYID